MKRLFFLVLSACAISPAVWVHAFEILLTPDYVYEWAQKNIERGTNFIEQGEFYLAELQLNGARGNCDGFFSELAAQDAVLPELDISLAALRDARSGAFNDPEASLRVALDTRIGLQKVRDAISVDNPASLPYGLKRRLGFAIDRLDALAKASEAPSSEALAAALDAILQDMECHFAQTDTHRSAFEALSPKVDAALLSLARAREELDVSHVLAVAQKHIDDASCKLDHPDNPHSINIEWDLELASHTLDDLRHPGPFPEEGVVLERRIEAETIRFHRGEARNRIKSARETLLAGYPERARSTARTVRFPLEHLPPDDPERVQLTREAENIQQDADKLERELENARCQQSLDNVRNAVGRPDAPVASNHFLVPSDIPPGGN